MLSNISKYFVLSSRRMASVADKFAPNNSMMLPKGTYKDKVVLITGGGTGLGKASANAFAELGASVFISSRREPVLQDAVADLTKRFGGKHGYSPCDVRLPEDVAKCADACVSQLGRLPDVVMNNAAGNFISPFERLSPKGFKTVVDIVLNGTANVTLELGKRLIKAGQPATFLQVTTSYAATGSAYVVPSAAAKAGVEVMAKSLSTEWARHGLRFVCVAPGPIYTEGAFDRLDPTGAFLEHMKDNIPCQRLGTKEEFANLVTYLSSPYASWINGTSIIFDGGELTANSGEFNQLRKLPQEMWDHMSDQVRKANEKHKTKSSSAEEKTKPTSKL